MAQNQRKNAERKRKINKKMVSKARVALNNYFDKLKDDGVETLPNMKVTNVQSLSSTFAKVKKDKIARVYQD